MLDSSTPPSRNVKKRSVVLLAALLVLLFAAAASIPFVYESTTLWYQFGLDRVFLLSGQVIGLLTLVLLGLQMLLAARFGVLERMTGPDKAFGRHRRIGLAILALACTHAVLILLPEGLDNMPIGWKYWPEMIGASALLLLCIHVVSASYRLQLPLRYPHWRRLHGLTGFLIFLALNIHVLFVSTSFSQQGLPRFALFLFSGTILVSLLLQKAARFVRRSPGKIS